ncbi:MAG: M15 family metallopeptidase, partial [Pseudomonas sp.]
SPERQADLLASGKGITTVGAMRSCHQYGLALDSVLMRNGQPQWDMTDPWTRRGYFLFGELATRDGLEWGGHWTEPRDFAHVELKSECFAAKRSADKYFAMVAVRMRSGRFQ